MPACAYCHIVPAASLAPARRATSIEASGDLAVGDARQALEAITILGRVPSCRASVGHQVNVISGVTDRDPPHPQVIIGRASPVRSMIPPATATMSSRRGPALTPA